MFVSSDYWQSPIRFFSDLFITFFTLKYLKLYAGKGAEPSQAHEELLCLSLQSFFGAFAALKVLSISCFSTFLWSFPC